MNGQTQNQRIEPALAEFHIGSDRYGRRVTLTRTVQASGASEWQISRAPHDQRDDSPKISAIPDDVMLCLARVVTAASRRG